MVKVFTLGLDGLDPSMLHMLPSLPTKAVRTKLDSLIPLTFPSWVSIMTGVNPGKHGIYGFFKYRKTSDKWKAHAFSAYDLQYPRVHEALAVSRAPHKSLIIGPMPPIPCLPVRNSDILSITQMANFSFTSREIANKLYDIKEMSFMITSFTRLNTAEGLREIALKILDAHMAAVERIANLERDYDYVWLYIGFPDNYLHRCPEALNAPDKLLKPIFVKLNQLIKKATEIAENIMVVSDHGFGQFKRVVRVNRILYDHGLIEPGKGGIIEIHEAESSSKKNIIRLHPKIIPHVHKILHPTIRKLARRILLKIIQKALHKRVMISAPPCIDEQKSKAFMPVGSSPAKIGYVILLNDYSVAERVIKILEDFDLKVYKAEDLLSGPYVPKNIVFVLEGEESSPTAGTTYSDPIEKSPIVTHRRYGVFIAKLEDQIIARKEVPEILPNTIVAPLTLLRLNAPLGVEMDSADLALRLCNKGPHEIKYLKYQPLWISYKRVLLLRNRVRARGKSLFGESRLET